MGLHKRPLSLYMKIVFSLMSKVTLTSMDNSEFLRYNLIFSTHSIGSKIHPAQYPLTITLVIDPNILGLHSSTNFMDIFSRNQSIRGRRDVAPFEIRAVIASDLCNPILPPSGVSIGSINPH